jgi:hypothetical protein
MLKLDRLVYSMSRVTPEAGEIATCALLRAVSGAGEWPHLTLGKGRDAYGARFFRDALVVGRDAAIPGVNRNVTPPRAMTYDDEDSIMKRAERTRPAYLAFDAMRTFNRPAPAAAGPLAAPAPAAGDPLVVAYKGAAYGFNRIPRTYGDKGVSAASSAFFPSPHIAHNSS